MSIFKKPRGTVASIHLYGAQAAGHDTMIALYDKDGEIVCKPGKDTQPDLIGTGDKLNGRSATDVIFLAVDDLRTRGITKGVVEVHYDFDFGSRVARFKLEDRTPYFGEMKWEMADVIAISAEAIIAAAEQV